MLAVTFAVVTTAVLCLLFPETRWMGVLGAGLLAYLHPLFLLSSAVIAALFAVAFHIYQRRSYHALPSPDE